MHTCIQHSDFRQTYDSNKSVQIGRQVIFRQIFVQTTFETRKISRGFYVLRQGDAEGRSCKGYASFKQIKPFPWHVEDTPGVSSVGLVTIKELCQVFWELLLRTLCVNIPLL